LIEFYEFGRIVIDGKEYLKDDIVLPNRVIEGKWRKKGHKINEENLMSILEQENKIETIIFGTGNYGLVKITAEIREILESRGIKHFYEPTEKACETFNEKTKSTKNIVMGFFHLNC
jgi:hypothetical protein